MSNMELYNKLRAVPVDAQKKIAAGRLKGFTDINPMWRIKALTEQFGVCGLGWYYDITKQWIEQGANGTACAFVNVDLFIKAGDEWSKPIKGTGGSMLCAKESGGIYTSDECYKMALTDAISIACKALGMGADVYYDKDRTKYDVETKPTTDYRCEKCGSEFTGFTAKSTGKKYTKEQAWHMSKQKNGIALCGKCAAEKCSGGTVDAKN